MCVQLSNDVIGTSVSFEKMRWIHHKRHATPLPSHALLRHHVIMKIKLGVENDINWDKMESKKNSQDDNIPIFILVHF